MVQPYIRPIKIERWFVLSIGSSLERSLPGIPSELVETENGCRASAKQAFFIPSNFAETENGCRASARQAFSHHRILSRPKMDVGKMQNKLFFAPSDLAETENGWKILAKQGQPQKRRTPELEHPFRANKCTLHLRQLGCQGDSPPDTQEMSGCQRGCQRNRPPDTSDAREVTP